MVVGLGGWGVQEQGWRKGPWTVEEDKLLIEYVSLHGEGRWSSVARSAGLNRSGKSCRLRWVNYLRPGLKKSQLTPVEVGIIIELHALWGNKWSTIARCLPGRTDNEIKNYWRTHFKNKVKSSPSQEKLNARALRRQQLNKQQHQQQLVDEKNVQFQREECDYKVSLEQARQEMVFMCPTMEDQCLPIMCPTMEDQCLPIMCQDCAPVSDSVGQESLWDSLWNLDDVPAQFNNKVIM